MSKSQLASIKLSDPLMKWITWIVRISVGAVFIFSGFVKAVDPWGTYYKFQEYFAAMGLPTYHGLIIVAAFGLCAAEFLLGVFTVLGSYRKSTPVLLLIFMCVMLPLTLWIAVSNPVSDCGCFGEAVRLSNWTTFWKNVVLTGLIIWLLYYNRRCTAIISPAFQWISALISLFFITIVMICGYKVQPLIDFRPYPIGSPLLSETDDDGDADFVFIYEKDGVQKEYGVEDDLPDEADGWTFVERKEIAAPATGKYDSGSGADDRTFRIWNRAGDEDVSEQVVEDNSKLILLLMPDMKEVSPATTWKINALHHWISKHGGAMAAVVSGSSSQIRQWEDLSLPDYEIFTSDDTAIKEVARGNPAIVYLEDGVIRWKTTLAGLEVAESEKGSEFKPNSLVTDSRHVLQGLIGLYIIIMMFPLILTLLPRIKQILSKSPYRHRQDKRDNNASTQTPAK